MDRFNKSFRRIRALPRGNRPASPGELKREGKAKMNNEEKTLSMLDIIAAQVTRLTETSVTKDEFQSFKMATKDELQSIKDNMVTKDEFRSLKEQVSDRFDKIETENNTAYEAILAKMDEQSTSFDAKFDVLTDAYSSKKPS